MTDNPLDFSNVKPFPEKRHGRLEAEDIKARLLSDVRSFVRWLYSGRAHIGPKEARIGDVAGTKGASLSIALHGQDAGRWQDFSTGEKGDILDLYMAFRGYDRGRSFQLALKEIASEYLGQSVELQPPDSYRPVTQQIKENKESLGTTPRQDFLELGIPVNSWKYYDTRGNLIASVRRYEPDGTPASKTYRPYCYKTVNGKKTWTTGAPDLRPLFRLPDIAFSPSVVLVEGEKCAQALADLGIEATTAMQGAKAPIEKTDWSPLQGKEVILWPDADAPGHEYMGKVAGRLLALGCKVSSVTVPPGKNAGWDAADAIEERLDPHDLIAAAKPLKASDLPKSKIRILDISELADLPPPEWLVENIITENGMSVWWGKSGALKSFVALDIAMSIASGLAFQGHPVKAGPVVYLAAEGAYGLAKRVLGWQSTKADGAPAQFKLIPHPVSIVGEIDDLIAAITALPEKPSLVVLDTLARTFGSGHENDTADMGAYVVAVDRLREATGAHVAIVHHSGKDEERGERGNVALRGACDTVVYVNRIGRDKVHLVNESPKGKQKDADAFDAIKLRSQVVEFDQKDQRVSTLILMLDDDVFGPEPEGKESETKAVVDSKTRYGRVEIMVLTALEKAGTALGITRLTAMTELRKSSIVRALYNLEDKNAVRKITPDEVIPALWEPVVCN
jgi:5S rRNA maturation endonuclease (ribonuclease M5)